MTGDQESSARSSPTTGVNVTKAQVWLIIPEQESNPQLDLREEVLAATSGRGLSPPRVRRSRACRVLGGPEKDRRFHLLDPRDARDLYSAMHRTPVLVLATASCFIRQDPSAEPVRKKSLISLQRYCQYKAPVGIVRGPGDPRRLFDDFDRWLANVSCGSCAGSHDPRALPLHVFDPSRDWSELDDVRTRAIFDARCGIASKRTDSGRRVWTPVKREGHGSDTLIIAGTALPKGFHWDLNRGRRGQERLATSYEVWKLGHAQAYCNIYPDGYVRGLKQKGARRVWPAT